MKNYPASLFCSNRRDNNTTVKKLHKPDCMKQIHTVYKRFLPECILIQLKIYF